MQKSQSKPKVGVLATMSDLYRRIPSLQPRMEKWAQEVFSSLGTFADVLYQGVCDTRSSVDEAVAKMEQEGADLLLVFPLTYTPSHIAVSALRATSLPVLLLNTQILRDFTAEADASCFIDNQAPTGFFDLCNVLVRLGVPFRTANGHYRDPDLLAEIRDWCLAAQAAARVRRMRIGLIGYPMEGAGDLAVDPTTLLGRAGPEVIRIPVPELARLAAEASEREIREQMDADHREFQVDPDLTRQEHEASSRLEWALKRLVADLKLDGLSFHFTAVLEDGRIETIPVLGACKLLAEGFGYGGEGDVTCAAAVALMVNIAGEADFFETWGLDFEAGAVMKNHMGEGNYRLAREDIPVRLMKAPVGLGDRIPPAAPACVLKPGEATFMNLSATSGGNLKLTACEGKVPETLPIQGVRTPHGRFKPDVPLKEFLRRYAEAGGSHHGTLGYGRHAETIEKVAWMLDLAFERI